MSATGGKAWFEGLTAANPSTFGLQSYQTNPTSVLLSPILVLSARACPAGGFLWRRMYIELTLLANAIITNVGKGPPWMYIELILLANGSTGKYLNVMRKILNPGITREKIA